MDKRIDGHNLKLREIKEIKREEAEERNKAYQALSLEDKLARQKEGGKVWIKLMTQQADKQKGDNK